VPHATQFTYPESAFAPHPEEPTKTKIPESLENRDIFGSLLMARGRFAYPVTGVTQIAGSWI
jgi:hypothetical protein